ncbi:hypothetical protein ACLB2K_054841 [Fragaria x ananassa]
MADEGKKPHTVIEQLYNVLHNEHMRPYVSWNNDDSNHFTFYRNERGFDAAISSNFSAVSDFEALRRRLAFFGFESNGTEYWHKDGLFCKGKPELLLQIRKNKPVQAQPPRPHSYSQEDKINAMSLSKREAGFLDLRTNKRQHREESSNRRSEAHAPVLTHPSGVRIPDWCRPPGNRYKLRVLLKEETVEELNVYEKGCYLCGTMPVCDIQLQHNLISRTHAWLLFKSTGEAYIHDISSNGTFINKEKVPKNVSKKLQIGDWISFGEYGKGSYLFGKLPDCDFQLQHKLNSRNHAWLLFKPTGEAYIYDVSYLGTFINKNKVLKNDYTKLKIGNWISFGDPTRSYLFKDSSGEEPSKPIDVADVHVTALPPVDLPLPIEIPDWCGAPPDGYKFQVYENEKMVVEHNLHKKGSYLFGKSGGCDFVLQHDYISRTHAWLLFKPTGEAYIYDISTGGTYINNEKVQKKSYEVLSVGDRISFRGYTRTYLFTKHGGEAADADTDV